MDVEINNSTTSDVYVLHVEGELDLYTASRLEEAISEGVSQGYKSLVVDLLKVGFLDSTALGVLVGALRRLRSDEGDLHLVIDDPHLSKIFRVTGFEGMFPIHSEVDTAVEAARVG